MGKFILGDCLEIMRTMPDKSVDLCLTDPPYGIGVDGQKESICKNPKHNRKYFEHKGWDDSRPSREVFDEILRVSKHAIIWGGNYFADMLPATRGWLVWDKGQYDLSMSDGELAWTTFDSPLRIKNLNRAVLAREGTIHPTQKPADLFAWCIQKFIVSTKHEGGIIFDPFAGSGTTAVCATGAGFDFICVERDPEYHAAAQERIANFSHNLFS